MIENDIPILRKLFILLDYCKKIHKSFNVIQNIIDFELDAHLPEGDITTPPQCMPDEYRDKNYVTAYRRYYNTDKKYFAKWEKGRSCPEWWIQ